MLGGVCTNIHINCALVLRHRFMKRCFIIRPSFIDRRRRLYTIPKIISIFAFKTKPVTSGADATHRSCPETRHIPLHPPQAGFYMRRSADYFGTVQRKFRLFWDSVAKIKIILGQYSGNSDYFWESVQQKFRLFLEQCIAEILIIFRTVYSGNSEYFWDSVQHRDGGPSELSKLTSQFQYQMAKQFRHTSPPLSHMGEGKVGFPGVGGGRNGGGGGGTQRQPICDSLKRGVKEGTTKKCSKSNLNQAFDFDHFETILLKSFNNGRKLKKLCLGDSLKSLLWRQLKKLVMATA